MTSTRKEWPWRRRHLWPSGKVGRSWAASKWKVLLRRTFIWRDSRRFWAGSLVVHPPMPISPEVAVCAGVVVEIFATSPAINETPATKSMDVKEELIVVTVVGVGDHDWAGTMRFDALWNTAVDKSIGHAIELGLGEKKEYSQGDVEDNEQERNSQKRQCEALARSGIHERDRRWNNAVAQDVSKRQHKCDDHQRHQDKVIDDAEVIDEGINTKIEVSARE